MQDKENHTYELKQKNGEIEIWKTEKYFGVTTSTTVEYRYYKYIAKELIKTIVAHQRSISPLNTELDKIYMYLKILESESFENVELERELRDSLFDMITNLKDIKLETDLFCLCRKLRIFKKQDIQKHLMERIDKNINGGL